MGAQSAALLASGGPLGRPRPGFPVTLTVALDAPEGYVLDRVARAHGGVGLAPRSYADGVLTTVLPDATIARVHPDLEVELSGPTDLQVLRRVLDLDRDLSPLWAVAPSWVRECRAGRELRASTALEALAVALAGTNTSYRSSQAMLHELVGDGPFPPAGKVVAHPLRRWGYRREALRSVAREVENGLGTDWDDLDDEELHAQVRSLRGFGPFAAASVLPLLGRPRRLLLDGWLAAQVPDPTQYARFGRWAGTVLWLDVSRRWLGPVPPPVL